MLEGLDSYYQMVFYLNSCVLTGLMLGWMTLRIAGKSSLTSAVLVQKTLAVGDISCTRLARMFLFCSTF